MEPKKPNIQQFISSIRTTETQRFEFSVPDTVEQDLTWLYRFSVERSGRQFVESNETKQVIRSTANWMKKGRSGLLLSGTVGTGKSKLMEAISLLFQYYTQKRQAVQIFKAKSVCELSISKLEDEQEQYRRLTTYLYLGIDDVGTEPLEAKKWGTKLSPVIDLLDTRYDKRKVTIITSNFDIDSLGSIYGQRIGDRLYEQYDRISFDFKSFRRK